MQNGNICIGGVAYKKRGLKAESSDSLMALLDLIENFNRLTDLDEILAEVGKAAKSIMNVHISSVMLLDEDGNKLCIRHCEGPVKNSIKGKCFPRDEGFCGWTVEHKLPLIANEIDDDSIENNIFGGEVNGHFTAKNLICAPLLDRDNNVMGVIEAINRYESARITEADIPVFEALANHAASAIERAEAWESRGERLKEQDMYLTEIHHRVKNDLALISGIVEIESLDIESDEAKNVLRDIQSRIKSLAAVYELLSGKGSHTRADVGIYFKKLVRGISRSLEKRDKEINIDIQTEPIDMDPYKALACGLILNELILNSYKHAFQGKSIGSIKVKLSKKYDTVFISYQDNGPGLPKNFNWEEQESIGFQMIHALVDQLDGTFETLEGNGAHFVISFQVDEDLDENSNPGNEPILSSGGI